MKLRSCRLVIATGLFLVLAGCTATYQTTSDKKSGFDEQRKVLALLPLVNLTSYPNAGRIMGDILATELYARSSFRILERTEMVEKIQGEAKDLESIVDNAAAVRLGKKAGAEMVLCGSVSEYRYKRGLDEEPAVGINLRLLDVEGNRVIWAGSVSATSNCFFLCRDSLNLLAHEKCADLVTAMLNKLSRP